MTQNREQRDFARELRQRMNAVEATLWQRLRNRKQAHFKFRRDHSLGKYVADFWCPASKVVVELDGVTHRERVAEDAERDAWMQVQGILVMRFKNPEVEQDLEAVLNKIVEACSSRIL